MTVVPLSTPSKPVIPIDDETVGRLRDLLARAERGEIQGICIATVESDGAGTVISVGTSYGGEGVLQNTHAALGGIEALKSRFIRERLD